MHQQSEEWGYCNKGVVKPMALGVSYVSDIFRFQAI
jgi:hypothetical protein